MLSTTKINRLSTFAGHQLEAEQVIPDLSSAVKEIVENSLDSNPSSITITFVNYGLQSIIIEDDGEGVSAVNMNEIASNRYATSKIFDDSDLETSINYGFRGEALHSLVKLSKKVVILSTQDNSGSAVSKTFSDFGTATELEFKPRTKGTSVLIEGLFECISVRRQDWLQRKSSIFSQVIFLLQSFAIMTPEVKFSVYTVKENTAKSLILFSIGKNLAARYIECMQSNNKTIERLNLDFNIKNEKCSIEGICIKNKDKNKNKSRFVSFINRKPFDSPKWQKIFQQMIKKNFVSGIEFFISVQLPGLWIDFNVTPDKRTIFILNESEILKSILVSCENAIRSGVTIETRVPDLIKENIELNSFAESQNLDSETCCWDNSIVNLSNACSVQMTKEDISKFVPIGQFNNGFVLCSKITDNFTELFAVDQHAADERIRFEEIVKHYSVSCQKLVNPINIKLPIGDEDVLTKKIDIIRAAGFLIRNSNGTFYLDGLPVFHGAISTIEDFYELIDYLKDHGVLYKNLCPRFLRVLASRACRSAVMIGSPLTTIQLQTIIKKLSQTDYPWICAHGRPTIQFLKRINFDL